MKNKIENLIKEAGINEVEAILNKLKSKVNVKENLKKDFIELLKDCTISFDSDVINYKKGEEWFFYYRKSNNKFYIQYKFWFDFEKKYNLNYKELQELLSIVIEEVLNYKRVTPERIAWMSNLVITNKAIMKNKIENLIKEAGIDEVEAILNKDNVKENLKKDFIELLEDCTISFDGKDIDYRKNGNLFFLYRKINNYFYLNFDFWLKFQEKYSLNYQELQDLLAGIVEEVLNYKGVTPQRSCCCCTWL